MATSALIRSTVIPLRPRCADPATPDADIAMGSSTVLLEASSRSVLDPSQRIRPPPASTHEWQRPHGTMNGESSEKEGAMRTLNVHWKIVAVAVAFMSALTTVVAPAIAGDPHFVGKVTAALDAGQNVQVCWREVHLDKDQAIDYSASANVSATYRCVTPLGICPGAISPVTVTGPVTTEGTFSSGKNGHVAECLTIQAPPPPTDPACSGPLTLDRKSV